VSGSRRFRVEWLLLLAILAAGAGVRVTLLAHHQKVDFDEGRYLDNAVHLLEGNGFQTSTLSHFFGDPEAPPRPEEMSSPLYPILLAGLFTLTGVSFLWAKILSLILSLAAIPLVFLVGRRFFGAPAGLVAAAAFALQPDQAIVGIWAMSEPLFTLLILLTLLAASPWLLPGEPRGGAIRLVALGILLAALFLTRQNGAALSAAVACLIVAGPAAKGRTLSRRLLTAGALAGVVFACSIPWFIRNLEEFGSPTYSRMKNVAWAEHGRSLYTPGVGEPTWRTYLAAHGARGLAGNLLRRAQRVAERLLFAETGPFRLLALAGLAAPLVARLVPPALGVLVPAGLSVLLLMGVAPWSGALARYMLPVRPLLYAAGAASLLWVWGRLRDRFLPVRAGRAAAAIVLVAAILWGALSSAPVFAAYVRADQERARDLALEASAFISSSVPPGELLMEGAFLHEYACLFRRGVVWTPYGDLDAALTVADGYGARYLAISPEVIRFRPQLAVNWSVRGTGLVPLTIPARLRPVFDRAREGLIIYQISPRSFTDGGGESAP